MAVVRTNDVVITERGTSEDRGISGVSKFVIETLKWFLLRLWPTSHPVSQNFAELVSSTTLWSSYSLEYLCP